MESYYLYIDEFQTVWQSKDAPGPDELAAIDNGILQVFCFNLSTGFQEFDGAGDATALPLADRSGTIIQ